MPSFNLIRGPNLHSVASSGFPLGVACNDCGHRARLDHKTIDAHRGNMKEVPTLKLKCAACGSRKWTGTLFYTEQQMQEFIVIRGEPAF